MRIPGNLKIYHQGSYEVVGAKDISKLTPNLSDFGLEIKRRIRLNEIRKRVESGEYSISSEVIAQALLEY